jgi:hypothetical protein
MRRSRREGVMAHEGAAERCLPSFLPSSIMHVTMSYYVIPRLPSLLCRTMSLLCPTMLLGWA